MSDRAIRIAKFEIVGINGHGFKSQEFKEAKSRWYELSEQCQRLFNSIWQRWEAWHVENETPAKLRVYLAAFRKWHAINKEYADSMNRWADAGKKKKPRGAKPVKPDNPKPKCDLFCWTPEVQKAVYRYAADQVDGLNLRPLVLVMNKVQQGMQSRKAASGSLPGWMAILLGREGRPSATRPQAIPFDRANAKIIPPAEKDGNYQIEFRLDRIKTPGRKTAVSTVDRVELQCKGRKAAGQVALLKKVVDGQCEFKGSSLVYSKSNRKWFVHVSFELPMQERAKVDANVTAYLYPGPMKSLTSDWGSAPWFFFIHGVKDPKSRIGGNGEYVGGVRQKLLTQRWHRQGNYRNAGSSNKGHGLNRAITPLEKLSQKWKCFVKNANNLVTKYAIERCIEHGAGKIVFLQPQGNIKDSRFLMLIGKIDGKDDSTGWDWFQAGNFLEQKGQAVGIEVEVRKWGREDKEENDPRSVRGVRPKHPGSGPAQVVQPGV